MNKSMIRFILGKVLLLEAAMMLLPSVVAALYMEKDGFSFLISALICVAVSLLLSHKKPTDTTIYLKEGCVSTALSWILMSIFGCLPFVISGAIPSFTDALFETISGFTTTGASILSDVEALSHCMIFWRSFTHWIGGMGVLVFLLAVVPMSGGSNINLMRAESPGPSVGKLVPKMRYTARILYVIYFGMTILQIVLLLVGKMPLFDAVTTAFGTAGTGGFGIKNDSIGSYSAYIQWVTTIFMILFGINFNAYYLLLMKKFKQAFAIEEVRAYLLIILVATGVITFYIMDSCGGFWSGLRHAAFQVGSIITTTGYSTVDFNLWHSVPKTILVILMFVGACAGSTGGGIKVSRFVILFKSMFKELDSYIHPKVVKKIKMDGKPVEHEVVRAVNVFTITYIVLFVVSIFLVSLEGKDLVTSFTAVTATLNNIGPGLELVGPTQNFGHFSILTKYVLMFNMLAGRLELFPLLILFHPALWKDLLHRKKKTKETNI